MAQGIVTIDEINLFQGVLPTVEKRLVYIGVAPLHNNTWQFVNATTDFDVLLGTANSDLKKQLQSAQVNGGKRWCDYRDVATYLDVCRARAKTQA